MLYAFSNQFNTIKVTINKTSGTTGEIIPHIKTRMWSACAALFVCVEVLRPNQPNGVMSSTVSLPNHTFTGQA